MKTIGVIGGMSWESTAKYYQLINEGVKKALGGLHSAKIIISSVDFAEIEEMQKSGHWDQAADAMVLEAQRLEKAGADYIFLATNTMHKVADEIEKAINIEFVHLADSTANAINDKNYKKVGLLGTIYTMEQDFYKGRLQDKGLDVIIPDKEDRVIVNDIIFEELCLGKVNELVKSEYIRISNKMINDGAEAIILGCTEIGMLISDGDLSVEIFDTTCVHVEEAIKLAVGKNK